MNGHWDMAADIVVVGSGFAGLCAAVAASQAGARVLVLEKMKGLGGNSVISDAVMAAAGTGPQREAGIEDSPRALYQDMLRAGLGLNHPDLAMAVAQGSAEAFQWLVRDLGVAFEKELVPFGGHSVVRGHAPARYSGASIIKPLVRRCRELGVDLRTGMLLESLLLDNDRVCGVVARQGYRYPDPLSGEPLRIQARRAVVLASGGFAGDLPFRLAQDPRLDARVDSTNRACTTGEALRAALRAGANPVHLSWIQLGPWTSPDEKGFGVGPDFATYVAFPYGLLVDPATGERFVDEMADRKTKTDAMLKLGRPCVAMADEAARLLWGKPLDHCLAKGVVRRFMDLGALASAYGIPLEPLEKTIALFNRSVAEGRAPGPGKPAHRTQPLSPPLYAMRVWPKVHHTMGGVQIDARARVVDTRQRPLPGLYAAGEVTGGVHGANRLGGCAVADCVVFGLLAGRHAAEDIPQ